MTHARRDINLHTGRRFGDVSRRYLRNKHAHLSVELLEPQHPLSYEQFKAYAFDDNATMRYALSLLGESK